MRAVGRFCAHLLAWLRLRGRLCGLKIFAAGAIEGGDYRFDIGSAGGTVLVAQTIIPILSHAKTASTATITGGTHNMWAPTFDYLERAFLPLYNRMGGLVSAHLVKYGFVPAGGGEIVLSVKPTQDKRALDLQARGDKVDASILAVLANLKRDIASREIKTITKRMDIEKSASEILHVESPGSGNAVSVFLDYENLTEVFTGLGQHGVRAETVASRLVDEARQYFTSDAAVGEHLADQLLLPMALFGGGVFTTTNISLHTRTNADIVQRFLDVDIKFNQLERKHWLIRVTLPSN